MVNLSDIYGYVKDIDNILRNVVKVVNNTANVPLIFNSIKKMEGYLTNLQTWVLDLNRKIKENTNLIKSMNMDSYMNPVDWWQGIADTISEGFLSKIESFYGTEMNEHWQKEYQDELTRWPEIRKIDNISKSWYDFEYSPTRKYQITYRQDIKIRKLFEKIYGQGGYPIKSCQYIGYFSSLGFYIPDGWVVHTFKTKLQWIENPSWRWRKVFIMYIGQENMKMYESGIPFTIDTFVKLTLAQSNLIEHGIFENLGFYNTINRGIIKANWDKVKTVLEHHGY